MWFRERTHGQKTSTCLSSRCEIYKRLDFQTSAKSLPQGKVCLGPDMVLNMSNLCAHIISTPILRIPACTFSGEHKKFESVLNLKCDNGGIFKSDMLFFFRSSMSPWLMRTRCLLLRVQRGSCARGRRGSSAFGCDSAAPPVSSARWAHTCSHRESAGGYSRKKN